MCPLKQQYEGKPESWNHQLINQSIIGDVMQQPYIDSNNNKNYM